MDSPLRVPPDESRGEAEKRRSVFSMPLPLINPFPRDYMLVSKMTETLTLCVNASLAGLPFVSGYPTFLFDKIV